jgi:alanyl-tRNA synthetase
MTMDADGLRSAFTRYFVERGHTALPAAGLIPHDPSVLFTIAGMVQFKPYFTGEQAPPVPRATTIQPVFRTVDIELIGTDARHNTFFEMLGNFSFGDYFKEKAIPFAWGLVTDVLGFDPDRLWITVHESDDDAAGIWEASAGVAPDRIQRMGEDNFWRMGPIGPCGPCSEIYYDKGPSFGEPGGPARGGEDRFVEIWNLVFMQYEQESDGSLSELPKKSIDTGAGLERILTLVEGVDTIFQTDVMAPIVETAARLTGAAPGSSERADTALQILADHARAMTFLVSDGVFPSNDGRGSVLRRMIRRAVLRAHQLGVTDLVTPDVGHGQRVPEARARLLPRADGCRARGGGVPADAASWLGASLRGAVARARAASGRPRLSSPRHVRLPSRLDGRACRGARGHGGPQGVRRGDDRPT